MRKGKNHVESFFKNIKRYEMEFPDQKMKKYKNTRIPEMPMSKLKKKKKKTHQVPKYHCVEHLWLGSSLLNSRLISTKKTRTKIFITLISSYLEDTNKNRRRHFQTYNSWRLFSITHSFLENIIVKNLYFPKIWEILLCAILVEIAFLNLTPRKF